MSSAGRPHGASALPDAEPSSGQRVHSSPGPPSAQQWLRISTLPVARYLSDPHPETVCWPVATTYDLVSCLSSYPTASLSVCRWQDDFSIDHSDHSTLQLPFLWNLTQLLIKAQRSPRGRLLPASTPSAHCLPASTAIQTIGCLFWDVALCLPPSAWACDVLSAKLPPLSPLTPLLVPWELCPSDTHRVYMLHDSVVRTPNTCYCNCWSRYQSFLDWEILEDRN